MSVTGERLTFGQASDRHQADHMARYEFVRPYITDKVVLDMACGTGYGTAEIAKHARSVTGVDIDESSIEYAQTNFNRPTVTYLCESVATVVFPPETFDIIVSFETIEHLDDITRKAYLARMFESLKPDGCIFLSTPNKRITSPYSKRPLNPYHVLEYYQTTLAKELTNAGFVIDTWYGQRRVHRLFTYRIVYYAIRLYEKVTKHQLRLYDLADSATVEVMTSKYEPRYFVVRLRKK